MDEQHGKLIVSLTLIFFGVVFLIWGDKEVKTKGGVVLKVFSWPAGRAKYLKWPIAAALIYSGVMVYLSQS